MIGLPSIRDGLEPVENGYYEFALAPQATTIIALTTAQIPTEGTVVGIVHYEGGPYRFMVHGPNPTATYGFTAKDDDVDELNGFELRKWKARLSTAGLPGGGTIRVGLFLRRRR